MPSKPVPAPKISLAAVLPEENALSRLDWRMTCLWDGDGATAGGSASTVLVTGVDSGLGSGSGGGGVGSLGGGSGGA